MKVIKFGGTSLATAGQVKKVCNIILADPKRRLVVVSAPGKRFDEDIKVTDLLIALAEACLTGGNVREIAEKIVSRFKDIIVELGLPEEKVQQVRENIEARIEKAATIEKKKFLDLMKAAGEDICARLVAEYLRFIGIEAEYVNPKDAGMILSENYGHAIALPEAYDNLAKLKDREGIMVFPGFYGYTRDGEVVTFSRGGSDITGAILAAAVEAELYENFSDVDSVYAVNPKIVKNPHPITEITYREMRELAYAGFSVFHEEALVPVYRKGIPVAVKNTNNPDAPGTTIVPKLNRVDRPIVGIAGAGGFCSIYIRKYMMNREIGFGRKLLTIIEDEGLSYEHTPSGIDDISVILHQDQLNPDIVNRILSRIRNELHADDVFIEYDLALIVVAGEGLINMVGMAARATSALAKAGINIIIINQGSSEVSMMFGVKAEHCEASIRALYKEFFED
jgi:aspartate kinase